MRCGENSFTGTANGKQDAERNAHATVDAILLREGPCPNRCWRKNVFDNTPINTQVLRGAAAPKRKWFVAWLLFIPIIVPYWQAQASSDWDLKVFCLEAAPAAPGGVEA